MTLEKRGIPTAAIGVERLVKTVGQAMAKRHGFPGYRFVEIPSILHDDLSEAALDKKMEVAAPEVERVLLGIKG